MRCRSVPLVAHGGKVNTHIAHLLTVQTGNGGVGLVNLLSEIPTDRYVTAGFCVLGIVLDLNQFDKILLFAMSIIARWGLAYSLEAIEAAMKIIIVLRNIFLFTLLLLVLFHRYKPT